MISTITSSNISVIELYGSLPLVGLLVLLTLLLLKEISACGDDPRWQAFGRTLNIGILPLVILFVLVVVTRVSEVWR
jgi:hypothetical protein